MDPWKIRADLLNGMLLSKVIGEPVLGIQRWASRLCITIASIYSYWRPMLLLIYCVISAHLLSNVHNYASIYSYWRVMLLLVYRVISAHLLFNISVCAKNANFCRVFIYFLCLARYPMVQAISFHVSKDIGPWELFFLKCVPFTNKNIVSTLSQPTLLFATISIGPLWSSVLPDDTFFFLFFWKNSKFFQFVSKMSRGELIIEDNQVKQGSTSQSSGWADEFQTQYNANANSWGDQFVHEEVKSWMHANNCTAC